MVGVERWVGRTVGSERESGGEIHVCGEKIRLGYRAREFIALSGVM